MNRRFFLLAAPVIVAAPSLMKVSALVMPEPTLSFSEIVTATLRTQTTELIEDINRTNALLRQMSGIPSCLYGQYDGYTTPNRATIRLTF